MRVDSMIEVVGVVGCLVGASGFTLIFAFLAGDITGGNLTKMTEMDIGNKVFTKRSKFTFAMFGFFAVFVLSLLLLFIFGR